MSKITLDDNNVDAFPSERAHYPSLIIAGPKDKAFRLPGVMGWELDSIKRSTSLDRVTGVTIIGD